MRTDYRNAVSENVRTQESEPLQCTAIVEGAMFICEQPRPGSTAGLAEVFDVVTYPTSAGFPWYGSGAVLDCAQLSDRFALGLPHQIRVSRLSCVSSRAFRSSLLSEFSRILRDAGAVHDHQAVRR
jgi:hypothetical protein